MEYLFYYIPPTPNRIWEKANKTANFSHNTSFFVKTELQKLPVSYLKSLLSKNFQLFVKIARTIFEIYVAIGNKFFNIRSFLTLGIWCSVTKFC